MCRRSWQRLIFFLSMLVTTEFTPSSANNNSFKTYFSSTQLSNCFPFKTRPDVIKELCSRHINSSWSMKSFSVVSSSFVVVLELIIISFPWQNKILQLILPSGAKKSYRVSLDMTMKQLVMRVCSRESLNPRHHSLQYIDFKHEFLESGTTVDEIGVSQVRLMDKRGKDWKVSSRSTGNHWVLSTGHESQSAIFWGVQVNKPMYSLN